MNRLVLCSAVLAILTTPAFAQKVLQREPPNNALGTGKRVLVDDGSCPSGQILQVIGRPYGQTDFAPARLHPTPLAGGRVSGPAVPAFIDRRF